MRTKTFPVRILQDQTVEDTKTVGLTLSNPTGGAARDRGARPPTLSIVDDDIGGTIQFSAATYSVGEGAGNATIVLTRTGGTGGGATVDYATSDGTAVAGTDYTTATGTAIFAAGKTSLTFLVPILDNATPDGVRTVNLAHRRIPGPNAHHEARDPIDRGAEDLRQRPLAGVQCADLLGEGERGAGHDHGRAGRA